jgi:uncharacterized protein YqiB (DUF1249 family)
MNDIHARIYANLIAALGKGDDPTRWPSAWKVEKEPYQPLHVDVLECSTEHVTIALAHYYKQNGDLVPDPDMQVRFYPKHKMAEALTFQNSFGYHEVYDVQDGVRLVNMNTKRQLNAFLAEWSRNLKSQFWDVNIK